MDRPAIAVDDAALERGVDLARRGLDDRRAERLEEVAIDRRDADLEPGQVRPGDRLVEVEVEGVVVDHAGQEMRVHLLVVELLHVVEAAVPAQLRHRALGELPGVGFREDVGVEGAGHERHVDDAVLERVADLEGRHRLRSADVVDAQAAFAVRLDLIHEGLETLHVGAGLDERRDRAQGRLLGRRARRQGKRGREESERGETCPHV